MKIQRLFLLLTCALAMMATGCADDHPTSGRRAAEVPDRSERIEIPPQIGMTRGQVAAEYGRPQTINQDEMGERWVYLLNGGEIVGKSFIPFYPPVRPRFGQVFFGPDGRVRNFDWQHDPHA